MYFFMLKVKISLQVVKFPTNLITRLPFFPHHAHNIVLLCLSSFPLCNLYMGCLQLPKNCGSFNIGLTYHTLNHIIVISTNFQISSCLIIIFTICLSLLEIVSCCPLSVINDFFAMRAVCVANNLMWYVKIKRCLKALLYFHTVPDNF